ncbi:hypothetical protein K474DRAFT_1574994, partial [Panus rudis PR-1116 ss-1]
MITNFIRVVLRYGRKEPGLFGKCNAYFGTVETQGRGTLHCHMLVWLTGHLAPQTLRDTLVLSEEYRKKLVTWLESIIQCEPFDIRLVGSESRAENLLADLPSRDEMRTKDFADVSIFPKISSLSDDEFSVRYRERVNSIVAKFNWHTHTPTCWKYLRKGEAKVDSNCRMRIDGTTHPETTVDTDTGSITLRRLHPWIANYNNLVIFLLQSNMDIKYIGSGDGAKALLYYITDYITKPPLPIHAGLSALCYAIGRTGALNFVEQNENEKQYARALTMMVNSMMAKQEIPHQQVMAYLVGGGNHYRSHTFRTLHWAAFHR